MASPTVNAVVLSSKGEAKRGKLKLTDDCELTIQAIQAYFKKKSEPTQLGYYEYESYLLFLFGYKDGKAGTENKHEMPPPYDNLIAFGDMLLIASQERTWERPCQFTPEQYAKFYEQAMGGFESVDGADDAISDVTADDVIEEEDDEVCDESDGEGVEDEEDVAGSDVDEVIEDEPEPAAIKVKKPSQKKGAVASSGYQKQQQLLTQNNFAELSADDKGNDNKNRVKAIRRFRFLIELGAASDDDIAEFEHAIYVSTCNKADKMKVVKHWDNIMFSDIYVNMQRTLMANLHPESPVKNARLLERIKDGELDLKELPFMTAYELCPENWKELADRQMQREQKLLEGNKGSATDRFKCNRCGKRECTYYEMQTRSADEPMTIFVNCLNCGKRWRQ